MNKTFTHLVLFFFFFFFFFLFFFFFFVFVLKPKLNLNLSFCFHIYSKINLVLPLGFKVINVEHLHLKNLKHKVNIFQLINFCNCRIPNKKLYLCNISFLQKKIEPNAFVHSIPHLFGKS